MELTKIDSLEYLNNLLSDVRQKKYTNAVMMEDEYRALLKTGRLFFYNCKNCFIFLIDEDEYFRAYYYSDTIDIKINNTTTKEFIIEELDYNDRNKNKIEALTDSLRKCGLSEVIVNEQVSCNIVSLPEEQSVKNNLIVRLDKERIQEIYSLWKKYLKPSDIPFFHYNADKDDTQNISYLTDENGNILSCSWWKIKNRKCEIRHTVTPKDYRGCGYGKKLLREILKISYRNGAQIVYTYIDKNNAISNMLYEKSGFKKTGRLSYQLII